MNVAVKALKVMKEHANFIENSNNTDIKYYMNYLYTISDYTELNYD